MAQRYTKCHSSSAWTVTLSDAVVSIYKGSCYRIPCRKISVKIIKDLHDKIVVILDDIAAQLGLQHRPAPILVKNNKNRKIR